MTYTSRRSAVRSSLLTISSCPEPIGRCVRRKFSCGKMAMEYPLTYWICGLQSPFCCPVPLWPSLARQPLDIRFQGMFASRRWSIRIINIIIEMNVSKTFILLPISLCQTHGQQRRHKRAVERRGWSPTVCSLFTARCFSWIHRTRFASK